jgi:GT2 family glycosyltransferase
MTSNILPIDHRITIIKLHKPSLPSARNIGIRKSNAEIILFIDDDVEFAPPFLSKHIYAHNKNPDAAAVTGRIKLLPPDFYPDTETLAEIDPKTAGYTVNFDNLTLQKSLCVSGCNMSFKKNVFDKIGFFDPQFRGNALYEEIDLSFRLKKANLEIIFDPEAELLHLRSLKGGCRDKKGVHWGIDKFHNTALFFGRWLIAGYPGEFLTAMKNEIEFLTRNNGGRKWSHVCIYYAALIIGLLKGIGTKKS